MKPRSLDSTVALPYPLDGKSLLPIKNLDSFPLGHLSAGIDICLSSSGKVVRISEEGWTLGITKIHGEPATQADISLNSATGRDFPEATRRGREE